ncbi:cytochrome P450 3A41-like [Ornithodoros turicata]|uniref:cytochrome P450 3A41-like n=1 Tax=Ornithodoros turicata TaxID=34597 RepID=UPI00313A4373
MEVSPLTVAASLLVLAATYILIWVLHRRRVHQLFARYGIPGPKPELLWGNYRQLQGDKIKVVDQWIREHGKVFGFFEGEKSFLMVTDVDLIKQCFVKEAQIFSDRPRFPLNAEPFSSSLLLLRGDEWKRVRTMLNPCFSAAKIKPLMPIVDQCTDTFVKVLDDHVAKNKAVDIDIAAQALTLDIIAKAALAFEVNCQEDTSDHLLQAIRAFFRREHNIAVQMAIAFPILSSFFSVCYPLTEHGKFVDRIVDNVRAVIDLRKQNKNSRAPDLVQAMLDVRAEAEEEDNSQKQAVLEDRHVLANSFLFLTAGFDTTASSLTFTVYCLAKYPEEQEKVYAELSKLIPSGEGFTYDNVRELKYLDAVVNESLRMYPSVALFTSRACGEDVTIMDRRIPAGTNVLIPTWQLHHDPELWSDPWDFKPDRFLQEEFNPTAFLPFGLGPRICIGKRLALLELKVALCKLLRKYSVTLSETVSEPLQLSIPTSLLHARDGVNVRLVPREAKPA